MDFPCFMYHASEPQGRVFRSAEEFAQAGEGWVDTPAKLGAPAPAVVASAPATGQPIKAKKAAK